jgi:hypothetical protein
MLQQTDGAEAFRTSNKKENKEVLYFSYKEVG